MAEQSNFSRNMLLAGVLLGLATGGMGAYSLVSNKVEKPATEISSSSAKVGALVADSVELMEILGRDHTVVDVAPEGAVVNGKPRFAPIFYSPDLWQVSIDSKRKNEVIDLLDPASEPIHGVVPNSWFVANGLMDVMEKSDALDIDSDGDGFSNVEEFNAKTSPTDPKSYPALVEAGRVPKMEVVDIIRSTCALQVDSAFAYDAAPSSVSLKIFPTRDSASPLVTKKSLKGLKVGDSFGRDEEPNRFTIVEFVREKYSGIGGGETEESAVKVRDNVTVAGDKEFIIRAGSLRSGAKDRGTRNERGKVVSISNVVLRVTAGPARGESVKVAEGDTFKVPGADNIVCKLESIDDAGTVNILPEGAQSPVQVPKAGGKTEKK